MHFVHGPSGGLAAQHRVRFKGAARTELAFACFDTFIVHHGVQHLTELGARQHVHMKMSYWRVFCGNVSISRDTLHKSSIMHLYYIRQHEVAMCLG